MKLELKLRSFLAATTVLFASVGTSSAQQKVDLLTAPFGTGSYVLGNALEQIVNAATDTVALTASESPGLVFNVKKINSEPELRKYTMMAYTPGLDPMATSGSEPFDRKYPSATLIANYNLNANWLATFDESIRSKEDLIGKRVALGRPPQIGWTIQALDIVEHGWGLRDQIEFETLGLDQGVKSALGGQVDAVIVGGYLDPEQGLFLPSPHTNELLAAGRPLYHLSWGEDAIKATVEAGTVISPAVIPAGAFDGLETDLETFTSAVAWCAYPEFDEKAAYQITKAIIENVDRFTEYHALGKLMSRSALVAGWEPEDIHPGALRAYREAGILD